MELHWFQFLEFKPLTIAYFFSAVAWGHLLLHKSNPRSALAWTVAILFLPWVGVILYTIFGIARSESRAASLMRKAQLKASDCPEYAKCSHPDNKPEGHVKSSLMPKKFLPMNTVGRKLTGKSISGGNAVHPFFDGDAAYTAMLEAIEEAEDYVYLVTYIFNGGDIGAKFIQALGEAAQRGVDVRLMVDGMGQFYSWSRSWRQLKDQGVQVIEFMPLSFFPPKVSINLRNHRKVLVADGKGFTGGMNIADYHRSSHRDYAVQDVHFACSGPLVSQLREAFLLDWGFCTNNYAVPTRAEEDMCGDILCRVVLDGPGSGKDPLHELIYGGIGVARKSICIMTPYFLPTHEVTAALKAAALRGVDVRIILPEKNNIFMVHWATFHLLPTLLEVGVRIFYQRAPFAHTKLFLVDDYYVQMGSANFDARSLRLNFELNVECFDSSFSREMKNHFRYVQKNSTSYTLEDVHKKSLPIRLRNAACWLFSPYL